MKHRTWWKRGVTVITLAGVGMVRAQAGFPPEELDDLKKAYLEADMVAIGRLKPGNVLEKYPHGGEKNIQYAFVPETWLKGKGERVDILEERPDLIRWKHEIGFHVHPSLFLQAEVRDIWFLNRKDVAKPMWTVRHFLPRLAGVRAWDASAVKHRQDHATQYADMIRKQADAWIHEKPTPPLLPSHQGLQQALGTIRSNITIHYGRHEGVYPAELTEVPVEPVTGQSRVQYTQRGPESGAGVGGWLYNPKSGEVWVNLKGSDARGVPYTSY